jgi:hypothetical protein|tara:strand:- start:78 stop:248 length:171 start_codon:yes stop_codon:yes gene_type:complete
MPEDSVAPEDRVAETAELVGATAEATEDLENSVDQAGGRAAEAEGLEEVEEVVLAG